MTDLTALISALEKATGADRELDARIEVALIGSEKSFISADAKDNTRRSYGRGAWFSDADNYHVLSSTVNNAKLLTASIDAALAFMRAQLPGWRLNVEQDQVCDNPDAEGLWKIDTAKFRVTLWDTNTKNITSVFGPMAIAPSLPLAILLATLRAKQAEERHDAE
jgi:hypothetical protein